MTPEEIIQRIEEIKSSQRFDEELARSVPLLTGMAKEEIAHVRLQDAIIRTKLRANKKLADRVRHSRKDA